MRYNKETDVENAALQKFCKKTMFEQILITEYQENSLGLPLAVSQKNDLDNMSFLSNPRVGHLHDSVVILLLLPESFMLF